MSPSSTRKLSRATACAVAAMFGLHSIPAIAPAATQYWDGDGVGTVGGGPGQWDLTLNRWGATPSVTSFGPFANNDTATFGGTGGVVNVIAPLQGNIDVQSNGYLFQETGSGAFNWSSAVPTVNVATGVSTEMLASVGTAGSGSGLTKTGAGTFAFTRLLLTGTGPININGGTFLYSRSPAAPTLFGAVSVATGATLNLGKFNDSIGGLSGGGNVVLGTVNDATTDSLTGTSSVWGSTLIANADNTSTTFSGNILDDGGALPNATFSGGHLVKAGSGGANTLTLTGTGSTFRGIVLIEGGTLAVRNGNAIPDNAPVSFHPANSTTFRVENNETVASLGTLAAINNNIVTAVVDTQGNTLTLAGNGLATEFSGVVIGSGTIVKNGPNKQFFNASGNNSTFTGRYVVNGGMLGFGNESRLGPTPASPVANYFTLNGGTIAPTILAAATAQTLSANRGITVAAGGGGLYFNNPSGTALTIVAPITGVGNLTRSGPANITLQGNNSGFTGDWTVTDGILNIGSGAVGGIYDQTDLGAIPAGAGSWDISQARLQLANNTVALLGQTYTLASGAGETFSYGPGVVVQILRGGNQTLSVTVGDPAASSSTLIRKPNGTMLILANSGPLALGSATGEKISFSGGVSKVSTNGGADTFVPGIFLCTSDSSTEGFFATYDNAFGVQVAPQSLKTDLNLANNTDYFLADSTTTNNLTGSRAAYALKIGTGNVAASVNLNGNTLTLGAGPTTDPAQLIVNTGSSILATGGGTIAFGAREGIIYCQGTAGTVNGTITGSGGLTKMGFGTLLLASGTVLNYTGATRIEQGSISIAAANQLPQTTDLIFCGAPSSTAGSNPQLLLNGQTITVNSINTLNAAAGITTNAGGPVLQLGTNGVIKIQGSGNSTFNGKITSAGTTATVWNAGAGTLILGMPDAVFSDRGAVMDYDKLWVTNGGTVVLQTSADLNVFPASQGTPLADAYLLDNGTISFRGIAGAAIGGSTTGLGASLAICGGRGMRLNAGGGTIHVENPYQQIALTGSGSISGTATLTKTGDGSVLLPTGSTATAARWKLRVLGGTVVFQGDDSLGTAPTSLQADNITLDGGAIDSTGVTLSANRGITILAGGGTIRAGGNFAGPLTGSGPLRLSDTRGVAQCVFSGASAGYSGTVTLACDNAVYANATNALGTGTITNEAGRSAIFGTTFAGAIALSNPIVTNGPRTWDLSVSNASGDLTLSGAISGNAPLFKGLNGTSLGALQLTNTANSFTGDLVISQGTLIPTANNVLSNTSSRLVVNGAGQLIFRNNLNYASQKPLFISGGPSDVTTTASVNNTTGNNTFAGVVTLTSTTAIKVASATSLNLTNDLLGGAGSTLAKRDPGTLIVKNMRTGGLFVMEGTTRVTQNSLAAGVSNVRTLSINPGAKLDITNNKLVTGTTIGTASGSTYNGVTGMIQTGRNGGVWNASQGLTTTMSDATSGSGYTMIGVARGSEVRGIGASATDLWAGQTVTGSDTLVMYTYGGDANLSGNVDIDDYGQIDFNASTGGVLTGWYNGDFDYNGVQDIDDYGIIDFVVNIQGAPFFTAGDAGMTVSAVPEPASVALFSLGAITILRRQRRS